MGNIIANTSVGAFRLHTYGTWQRCENMFQLVYILKC